MQDDIWENTLQMKAWQCAWGRVGCVRVACIAAGLRHHHGWALGIRDLNLVSGLACLADGAGVPAAVKCSLSADVSTADAVEAPGGISFMLCRCPEARSTTRRKD